MKSKVWITDAVDELLILGLEELGYTVDYQPKAMQAEVEERLPNYEGIVINSKTRLHKKLLARCPNLRFIGRLGSGMEIIDLDAAAEQGIACFGAPEGNCNAVGEHALGMLLALLNRLHLADDYVRKATAKWDREAFRGTSLDGQTVGIIGYGHTGKAFAQKLSGFNVRVLAYDKYVSWGQEFPAECVTLQEIYERSTVLSLHLPLSEETENWLSRQRINQFRNPFILINTSRGKVASIANILYGIEQKKIIGACLDVFENENPETYLAGQEAEMKRLSAQENVILSPHVAGWTHESKINLARILLQKITRYASF